MKKMESKDGMEFSRFLLVSVYTASSILFYSIAPLQIKGVLGTVCTKARPTVVHLSFNLLLAFTSTCLGRRRWVEDTHVVGAVPPSSTMLQNFSVQ